MRDLFALCVAYPVCIISCDGAVRGVTGRQFLQSRFIHAKESSMSSNIPSHVRRSVQALIVSLMPALVWAGPVDINTADAATIAKELQGIGLSRAQAIVAYREKNGAFRSADDLRKIKGIGAKVLERNRANIKLDGGSKK
jgi:competence protein ComEA